MGDAGPTGPDGLDGAEVGICFANALKHTF